MGVLKDPNFEAIHFLSENQKAMEAEGGSWLEPIVPSQKNWTKFSTEVLYNEHFKLNGRLQIWRHNRKKLDWGFKDPRNSFTLEMWLNKFPKAKVIFIKRDMDSVVKSLQKRNTLDGEVYDPRLDDVEFCKELWQKYTDQCASFKLKLGDKMLRIDYKDIVQLNTQSIKALENFTQKSLKAHLKYFLR